MASGETAAPRRGWGDAGIVALVLAVVLFRLAPTTADPDVWGHVRFGLDMLQTGRLVPEDDPYSYLTAGHAWIDNEWLAEVILAGLYTVGGSPALILLKVGIGLGAAGLLYRRLCREGFNALWGGIVLLPAAYLMLLALTGVRVMIFTHLLFTLLMLLLVAAERDRRWLLGLPPLFALWINLHPGVLAGLACMAVWLGAHLVLAWRERQLALPFLLAGVGTALATLVNPYGVRLPVLLLRGGVGARPEITEFAPLRVTSPEGAAYLLLLIVCVAAWIYTCRPRSLPLLAVFACTAVTPLMALRHAPLFAIAALALTAPHLADLWHRRRSPDTPTEPIVGLGALLAAGVLVALSVPHLGCIRIDPVAATAYPTAEVARLKDSGVAGRLVVFFDWGEYVIWHVGPRVQVSIDGRRESAYPDDVYRRNFQFMNGVGDWDALLADGPADMALVSRDFAADNLLRTRPDWVLVQESPVAALFVRRDAPQRAALERTPQRDMTEECFP